MVIKPVNTKYKDRLEIYFHMFFRHLFLKMNIEHGRAEEECRNLHSNQYVAVAAQSARTAASKGCYHHQSGLLWRSDQWSTLPYSHTNISTYCSKVFVITRCTVTFLQNFRAEKGNYEKCAQWHYCQQQLWLELQRLINTTDQQAIKFLWKMHFLLLLYISTSNTETVWWYPKKNFCTKAQPCTGLPVK